VLLNKVLKGNFSRPHAHRQAREIYVVQGTWWVGSGRVLNPDASVPQLAGTFVVHLADQVHWDGAKAEDVLLLIEGDGPATEYLVK
jgi:quercetin dioxygenase-like cupin family protein